MSNMAISTASATDSSALVIDTNASTIDSSASALNSNASALNPNDSTLNSNASALNSNASALNPNDSALNSNASAIDFNPELSNLNRQDLTWILGLYGTAIGAGVLFLPINAGVGGLWPLIIMAILAFPMTFYSHRGLTRFVLSGTSRKGNLTDVEAGPPRQSEISYVEAGTPHQSNISDVETGTPRQGDITDVVEEHFGVTLGKLITLLYFFAIYPILLVYGVAITNTILSFMQHQLHLNPPPRALVAGISILGLMIIVRFGKEIIVKVMSILVFPFVVALMGLSVYLIPEWNGAILDQAKSYDMTMRDFTKTLWLAIPVMVFSFNHSPIISSFAVSQKKRYGARAEQKSSRILLLSHVMMVFTVLFFVFSCVLSLSPTDLIAAKEQNISILSYLANHLENPIFTYAAPLIAFVAIFKSFLGHYLGASEGFNGLVMQALRKRGKSIDLRYLNGFTAASVGITTWIVATLNPSILGMIESLGGPIIAVLLFIMPMYATYKVPAMRCYAGKLSNVFIFIMGCIAISAIFYKLIAEFIS